MWDKGSHGRLLGRGTYSTRPVVHEIHPEIRPETPSALPFSKQFFLLFSLLLRKLQASGVRSMVKTVLHESSLEGQAAGVGKKRNFVETIELQIGLKNYDPQRDKRFVSCGSPPSYGVRRQSLIPNHSPI